jgi:hypothetical protein
LKAGDHKVIGLNSAAQMRLPEKADKKTYTMAEYDIQVDVTVWGAQRKERFLLSWAGVKNAGQPRSNEHI